MTSDDGTPDVWQPRSRIGSYELMRELARGGMGEIWLARQSGPRGFDRLVVLKRIVGQGDEDTNFETMFVDEARIASSLQHPNIVQVFEFGQNGHSFYLSMEYLPGQSLSRVARAAMGRYRQIPQLIAVRIIADAAAGLGYAHQRRGLDGQPMHIVHRDVSPQNIHVTYDGQVKVLDFGIAQAAGRITKTRTGLVRGKVAYMAPEQAMAIEIDARADVFALGMVLFELLTGTRVYGKLDDIQIITQLATTERLPRATERAPKLSPVLDDLLARCMSFKVEERPADGKALHEELIGWLHTQTAGQMTLDGMMQELFATEIAQITTNLEPIDRTPQVSNPSLPDLVPIAEAAQRRKRTLLYGGIGAGVVALGGLAYGIFHSSNGQLRVVTQPPDAQITIDGKLCKAPCDVSLKPGEHDIKVEATGYATARKSVVMHDGEQRTIDLDLLPMAAPPPPKPAEPVDAGQPVQVAANTVEKVPEKPVEKTVEKPVEKPKPDPKRPSENAGGASGGEKPDRPTSGKAKGKLTLDTDPWTNVYLGKTKLGDTPLIEVSLPEGRQKLHLVNEDEKIDTVIEVEIRPGQTVVKKFAL